MENKKILTLFNTKQFIFFLLGIAAAVIFFVMTPFEGLSAEGMKVLGLFLLAIFWWMGSVFPDYVTAFWMMALMIATKATALGTVFSAFSGSVIWIVIPVLAVGAALSKTGLLKRIVLFILSKFKASFKSQSLGFIIAGNIVDALIPSATAKVAIAAPLAKTYSETMGYEPTFFGCDGMDGILGVEGFDTSLAEGMLLLTPFSAASTDEKTQAFVTKYQEAFGETPNQFAADAYDGIYALYTAVQNAGITPETTPEEACELLIAQFPTLQIDGLTGSLAWESTGEVTKTPNVYTIEGGVYVKME